MTTRTEQRLRDALTVVAEATPINDRWPSIEAELTTTTSQQQDRPRLVLLAAAVAVIAGGLTVLGRAPSPTNIDTTATTESNALSLPTGEEMIRPDELVLRTDPLVVEPAPTPEAAFDTSGLGSEYPFGTLDLADIDLDDLPGQPMDDLKITLIGTVDQHQILIRTGRSITDPVGQDLYERSVAGIPQASSVRYWDPTDQAAFDIDRPPAGPNGPILGTPVGYTSWDLLPAGTAIVTFRDDDRELWQIPRDQLAVFPSEFDDGESWAMAALAADGAVLDSHSGAVDYSFNIDSALSVGDPIGTVIGSDPATGETVRIEPNGQPVVLVVGGDWCVPCREVGPALDQLRAPDVRQFAINFSPSETSEWAGDTIYIEVSQERTIWRLIAALPTIIVLDGEHRLLATTQNPVDLPGLLADLDLS